MVVMDFETARHNMAENQIRCCKILDPILLDTFETMPREAFLPDNVKSLAYMEGHVPLPCGQEMLSPLQEGHIMQILDLQGDERVLEIGAGTGFLTALLAMHAKEIVAFELHRQLADLAKKNLAGHGITNATVRCANGMEETALKDTGEFDAIILGATLETVPDYFVKRLKQGGQFITFTGANPVVKLTSMKRMPSGGWQTTELIETLLQNMEGLPEKREFVF